jgi:hypothetical protein
MGEFARRDDHCRHENQPAAEHPHFHALTKNRKEPVVEKAIIAAVPLSLTVVLSASDWPTPGSAAGYH